MNKPGIELLVDLINGNNPDARIIHTNVTVIDITPHEGIRNTKGTIVGIPGMGYSESKTVYWDRRSLSSIIGNVPGVSGFQNDGTITLDSTTHDAIPLINNLMNGFIVFEKEQFEDLPAFEFKSGEIAIAMTPANHSIYWMAGDTGYFTCVVPANSANN